MWNPVGILPCFVLRPSPTLRTLRLTDRLAKRKVGMVVPVVFKLDTDFTDFHRSILMLQSCIHLRPIKYESLRTDSQARPSILALGVERAYNRLSPFRRV